MSGRFYPALLIAILLVGVYPVFAQTDEEIVLTVDARTASDDEFTQALEEASDVELINKNEQGESSSPAAEKTPAGRETVVVEEKVPSTPEDIINNEYFLESQRLAKLAEEAHDYGDYDASNALAQESIRYAELSDRYVAGQTGTPVQSGTLVQQTGTPVQQTGTSVQQTGTSVQKKPSDSSPLPATYTVRPWNISKDCFWNIAGYPWVYGNPRLWRVLYEANKSKLPNPNNPNWIEPGIVLDIPSIKGETRQGAWSSGGTYKPLP